MRPEIQFILYSAFVLSLPSCTKDLSTEIVEEELKPFTESIEKAGTPISAEISNEYNDYFTRYGGGWTGGDVAYSIPLPDGRIVWTFGDSFLGVVNTDRSRPFTPLIRNCFMVQEGENFTTINGGTIENPEALIETPDDQESWYWPGDGTVLNNKLYIFFEKHRRTGSGLFDFEYVRTDIAIFSLPNLTLESISPFWTDNTILFGAAIFEEGNYIYVYNTKSPFATKYCVPVRINTMNLGSKEYFTGTGWSSIPQPNIYMKKSDGNPLAVVNQFSVFKAKNKYRLITHQDFFGSKIYSYESDSPVGPWGNKKLVYTTPESGGNIWTYNSFLHTEITNGENSFLISYSVNSNNFLDVFENADNYRPKFIWVNY